MEKKDEERYFLEKFLKLMPGLDTLVPVDSEQPDFLCDLGKKVAGIEMTRFFFPAAGTAPQAIDGYREQLANDLKAEHAKRNIPPLHVGVHMYDDSKLMIRKSRDALRDELLGFIAQSIPPVGPHVMVEYEDLPPALYQQGVSALSILNYPKLTKPFWSFPYASFIPESSSKHIQAIIDKKASLVPIYRKKVDEVWLLIVSGTHGLHSIIDLDGDVLTTTYAGPFDRVFLFRTFGGTAHELSTKFSTYS